MSILADMKRLENENKLLTNLLQHALETSVNLRKAIWGHCPLLRYVRENEKADNY